MLQVRYFSFNPFEERTILLWDSSLDAVIVDPGCCGDAEFGRLEGEICKEKLRLKAIWLTHGHIDHIYGVKAVADRYSVPVFMHPQDKAILGANCEMAERFGFASPDVSFHTEDLEDGQILNLGESGFKVITTPGHTPGSVCFYNEEAKLLLSGDTLFAGSIGRTDLLGGDYDKLIVSIMDKIMGLDADVDFLPGHGPVGNLGRERTHNPFLQPFNEPEDTITEL